MEGGESRENLREISGVEKGDQRVGEEERGGKYWEMIHIRLLYCVHATNVYSYNTPIK